MARTQHTPRAREGEEIWETTTPGLVWVTQTDDRGKERAVSVGGKPGQRLRIKSLDRELMQDNILNDASDPFTNGLLKRIDADQNADPMTESNQALTTEELTAVFELNGGAFHKRVASLNELNVRRLREIAEAVDAKASQISHLDEVIESKYRQHGDTPTYRELKAEPQGASA